MRYAWLLILILVVPFAKADETVYKTVLSTQFTAYLDSLIFYSDTGTAYDVTKVWLVVNVIFRPRHHVRLIDAKLRPIFVLNKNRGETYADFPNAKLEKVWNVHFWGCDTEPISDTDSCVRVTKMSAKGVDQLGGSVSFGGVDVWKILQLSPIDNATAMQERQQFLKDGAKQMLADFRLKLKPGDETSCGLVVDRRGPIAKVQFAQSERWVKIEELFPMNSLNACSMP